MSSQQPGVRPTSYWMDNLASPAYPALTEDLTTNVAITGAGVAGLSTAWEPSSRDHRVVVEADRIATGITAFTTATACPPPAWTRSPTSRQAWEPSCAWKAGTAPSSPTATPRPFRPVAPTWAVSSRSTWPNRLGMPLPRVLASPPSARSCKDLLSAPSNRALPR